LVAFPPPPITLRQRSSTFAEPLRSLRRVLASGRHSFLSEWLEKVSQPSLAEPFGSDSGVTRINNRSLILSFGRHSVEILRQHAKARCQDSEYPGKSWHPEGACLTKGTVDEIAGTSPHSLADGALLSFVDFWHAVEFSRIKRTPSPALRPAPGQPEQIYPVRQGQSNRPAARVPARL
jgi:hypothetical protein